MGQSGGDEGKTQTQITWGPLMPLMPLPPEPGMTGDDGNSGDASDEVLRGIWTYVLRAGWLCVWGSVGTRNPEAANPGLH